MFELCDGHTLIYIVYSITSKYIYIYIYIYIDDVYGIMKQFYAIESETRASGFKVLIIISSSRADIVSIIRNVCHIAIHTSVNMLYWRVLGAECARNDHAGAL